MVCLIHYTIISLLLTVFSNVHADVDILRSYGDFLDRQASQWDIEEYIHQYNDFNSASVRNTNDEENAVESPLLVGSFNIQTLGKKKFQNSDIMSTVQKVILRYDLILLLEIMIADEYYVKKLLLDVNRLSEDGPVYNMVLGEIHPQTMERCVFFYRRDKLKVLENYMYYHPADNFYRKPLVVHFKAHTLRDMNSFVAIGLHVKPSRAVEEINALANVYDYSRLKHKVEDAILMGDFNADCDYVKERNWENISLWTRNDFTWPITHGMDTTTNHKSCALDRFVFAGNGMNDGVIMSSAQVYNLIEAFGITLEEARALSDHWPIELKIRGKMSPTAEKHLISTLCVTVSDSRLTNVTTDTIISRAKSVGFNATLVRDRLLLLNQKQSQEEVVSSLKTLRKILPELVTREQFQGIVYKVVHGGLRDDSSLVDVAVPSFWISLVHQNRKNAISVCRKTTVN